MLMQLYVFRVAGPDSCARSDHAETRDEFWRIAQGDRSIGSDEQVPHLDLPATDTQPSDFDMRMQAIRFPDGIGLFARSQNLRLEAIAR
jgi:hypothetical protein